MESSNDVLVIPNWGSVVLERLLEFCSTLFQSDATLYSNDGQSYGAHGSLLAAASPMLRRMIQIQKDQHVASKSILEYKLDLPLYSNTVESLLKFIYQGTLEISKTDLPAILAAAHFLELEILTSNLSIIPDKIDDDDEEIVVTITDWGRLILDKMLLFCSAEFMCDSIVSACDENSYKAHSIILAAASPTLHQKFLRDQQQPPFNVVEGMVEFNIELDYMCHIVELFMQFFYTGSMPMHEENLSDIRAVAFELDIEPLLHALLDWESEAENRENNMEQMEHGLATDTLNDIEMKQELEDDQDDGIHTVHSNRDASTKPKGTKPYRKYKYKGGRGRKKKKSIKKRVPKREKEEQVDDDDNIDTLVSDVTETELEASQHENNGNDEVENNGDGVGTKEEADVMENTTANASEVDLENLTKEELRKRIKLPSLKDWPRGKKGQFLPIYPKKKKVPTATLR